MKKFLLTGNGIILGAILTIAPAATAQQVSPPAARQDSRPGTGKGMGGDMERRLQHLTARLNLTEDQQKRIKPILQEESAEIKAVRDEPGLTRVQRRSKLLEIREAVFAKIQPVLTPAQQKKHDELRKQARERNPKGR